MNERMDKETDKQVITGYSSIISYMCTLLFPFCRNDDELMMMMLMLLMMMKMMITTCLLSLETDVQSRLSGGNAAIFLSAKT